MAKNPLRRPTVDGAGRTGRQPIEDVVRAGGVAAILGGLVMAVHEVWDARIPGIQEGSVAFSALHTTWVALMFVAILGLAALQRPYFGRLGRIATVVALVGTGGLAILALIETLSFVGSPTQSTGDPALPVLVLMFAVFACYVAGLLLFGVATFRARVLPRSAGGLLVVTVLLKMFASDIVPGTLALLGAAFVWLGVVVLRPSQTRHTAPIPESARA